MSLALDLLTKLYPEKLIPSSADILVPLGIEERFSYTFFDFGILWCLAIPNPLVNVTDIMFIHSFWKDQGQVVVIDLSLPTKVKDHQFIILKMAEINFVRSGTLLNVPGLVGKPSTMNDVAKRVEKKPSKPRKQTKPTLASPDVPPATKQKKKEVDLVSRSESRPEGAGVRRTVDPSDCPF